MTRYDAAWLAGIAAGYLIAWAVALIRERMPHPRLSAALRRAMEHENGSIDVLRMTPEMLARLRAGLVAEQRKLTEQL